MTNTFDTEFGPVRQGYSQYWFKTPAEKAHAAAWDAKYREVIGPPESKWRIVGIIGLTIGVSMALLGFWPGLLLAILVPVITMLLF